VTDEIVQANERYAADVDQGDLPMPPGRHVAVVACMDTRLDVYRMLGIELGEAHVIRNAGGAVTDDAIRSLAISQLALGTTEIVLVHHTDCGMLTFKDDDLKAQIQADTGIRPPFAFEAFSDLDARRALVHGPHPGQPLHPHKNVRGFVYDVATGKLREVT
jgi:carbonic anhydrase